MQLALILILAFVSGCSACASRTKGGNDVGIPALLERRGEGDPYPGSDSWASDLFRAIQDRRTSTSSIKKKRTLGNIVQSPRAVHADGSQCNDQAKPALAWKSRIRHPRILYGGEYVYRVPTPGVYGDLPVIIKKISITETNKKAEHELVTMMEQVDQLVDWGIAKEGEQEIWLVVQKFLGLDREKALAKGMLALYIKLLMRKAGEFYARKFGVGVPATASEDQYRFSNAKTSDVEEWESTANNQEEFGQWRAILVRFEGVKRLPRIRKVKPVSILDHPDSRVARAWAKKHPKEAECGGEKAYHVPRTESYNVPMVIKPIVATDKAGEDAVDELVEILMRVGQFEDLGVIIKKDGQRVFLVVQRLLGWGYDQVNLRDISKPKLQKNAQRALETLAVLPEADARDPRRYRYEKINRQWVAIIAGWQGGEAVEYVVREVRKPEELCMHSVADN